MYVQENLQGSSLDTINGTRQITLSSSSFCSTECVSGAVVINGTENTTYQIRGMNAQSDLY